MIPHDASNDISTDGRMSSAPRRSLQLTFRLPSHPPTERTPCSLVPRNRSRLSRQRTSRQACLCKSSASAGPVRRLRLTRYLPTDSREQPPLLRLHPLPLGSIPVHSQMRKSFLMLLCQRRAEYWVPQHVFSRNDRMLLLDLLELWMEVRPCLVQCRERTSGVFIRCARDRCARYALVIWAWKGRVESSEVGTRDCPWLRWSDDGDLICIRPVCHFLLDCA